MDGDIVAPRLPIAEGAHFRGRVEMPRTSVQPEQAPPPHSPHHTRQQASSPRHAMPWDVVWPAGRRGSASWSARGGGPDIARRCAAARAQPTRPCPPEIAAHAATWRPTWPTTRPGRGPTEAPRREAVRQPAPGQRCHWPARRWTGAGTRPPPRTGRGASRRAVHWLAFLPFLFSAQNFFRSCQVEADGRF